MTKLDGDARATLFRSRSEWPREVAIHQIEEIGSGSLCKIIRIALSDPDGEIWAYTIRAGDQTFVGDAIATLNA